LAVDDCIVKSLGAVDLLLAGDMARALMKIHAKPPRPKLPKPLPSGPAAEPIMEIAPCLSPNTLRDRPV
jgi:PTH1 family peptidyl-tRNA hydrolase